jgi:hypothetical protein
MEPQATRAPRIGVAFFYRTFMPTAYENEKIMVNDKKLYLFK